MTKVISEGIGALYHHYPRVAAIITAQDKGRANAMAAAWHMPISWNPPYYGVTINPGRFTYQLIAESKEFGVNFLPFEMAELVASVGGSRGEGVDKFQRFNIARDKAIKTKVPILEAAYAAYECQLVDDRGYGESRLLVGKIVAVHLLKEVFTKEGILDLDKVSPILYLGQDVYVTTSKGTVRKLDREVYGKV